MKKNASVVWTFIPQEDVARFLSPYKLQRGESRDKSPNVSQIINHAVELYGAKALVNMVRRERDAVIEKLRNIEEAAADEQPRQLLEGEFQREISFTEKHSPIAKQRKPRAGK